MPNPKDFKDEEEFMPVCVAQRQSEHPDEEADQSTAICMSMWEDAQAADTEEAKLDKAIAAARALLKYSDDQARDDHGRFGSGDGSGGGNKPPKEPSNSASSKPPKDRTPSQREVNALLDGGKGGDKLYKEMEDYIRHNYGKDEADSIMQDLFDDNHEYEFLQENLAQLSYQETLDLLFDSSYSHFTRRSGKKSLEEILARAKKVLGQ